MHTFFLMLHVAFCRSITIFSSKHFGVSVCLLVGPADRNDTILGCLLLPEVLCSFGGWSRGGCCSHSELSCSGAPSSHCSVGSWWGLLPSSSSGFSAPHCSGRSPNLLFFVFLAPWGSGSLFLFWVCSLFLYLFLLSSFFLLS